ncbi:hypothetical protein X970_00565 [Pseudomonas monteilii SB3101]|jgi:hypothetical protein|uniref:Uncharacterized protein n=2 Tax=Pseudomonas TaxID=286 RepID=V9V8I1_9PSED|nr:hypothetical protein X969_00575 [Pseudomonas monteilii SB3078]AHC91017.1 hypothetical protein X970_00565 [Pseudomonas monteilii SB3101]ESW37594.1 hypothetical protein O164_22975 [Pseudomonas taiwanensis SJ9]
MGILQHTLKTRAALMGFRRKAGDAVDGTGLAGVRG